MTSKSKKTPNDDLVDALESIRGLLEKNETKLSAARESLEKAKSKPIEKHSPPPKYKKPPISSEPIVPVLDDVVFKADTKEEQTTVHEDITMTDIPSLDFDAIVSKPETAAPPVENPKTPSGPSRKAIIAHIDKIESSLEQRIHDAMLETMAKVELEINNAVEEELKTLRKMITDKK